MQTIFFRSPASWPQLQDVLDVRNAMSQQPQLFACQSGLGPRRLATYVLPCQAESESHDADLQDSRLRVGVAWAVDAYKGGRANLSRASMPSFYTGDSKLWVLRPMGLGLMVL